MQRISRYGLFVSAALFVAAGFVHFRPAEKITAPGIGAAMPMPQDSSQLAMRLEHSMGYSDYFNHQKVSLREGTMPVRDALDTLFKEIGLPTPIDPSIKGNIKIPNYGPNPVFSQVVLDIVNRAKPPLKVEMGMGSVRVVPNKSGRPQTSLPGGILSPSSSDYRFR